MKVLFPFVGDSVGGSHISTVELYKGLQKDGVNATILLHSDDNNLSSFLDNLEIPFESLPIKSLAGEDPNKLNILISIIKNFRQLYIYLKKNNFDIVHGNDLRINLTWSLPAKLSGAKFIWHQRVLLSSSVWWKLIPLLSDYFVAISSCVLDSAKNINIKIDKKLLIYNPFNIRLIEDKSSSRKWLEDKFDLPNNSIIIGYLGRIKSYKNIDFLITAFSDFQKIDNKDTFLLIAGNGDPKNIQFLESQAKLLKIEKNVIFLGFVKNTPKFLSAIDILVAPSTVDAFGRSLVEAIIQKTPVIAAEFGGHIEIIKHLQNGYLYKENNKLDFLIGINWLLSNRSKVIDDINQSKFEQRFSSESHTMQVIDLYSKAISK